MRGLAATRSLASWRPTVAPEALLARRTASRKAQAASKAAPVSSAGTTANSAAEGHGARWMLRAPVACAKPHDQTSSVT